MPDFYSLLKDNTDFELLEKIRNSDLYDPDAIEASRIILMERSITPPQPRKPFKSKSPHGYYKIGFENDFNTGYIYIQDGSNFGVIDSNQNEILPTEYHNIEMIEKDLFAVNKYGLYGIIDKYKRILLPLRYDSIFRFSEGLSRISINYHYGYVNLDGEIVIPLIYDGAGQYFTNGKSIVVKNRKTGVINIAGREIVPLKYKSICFIDENAISLAFTYDNRYEFIDTETGKITPSHINYPDFKSVTGTAPVLGSINGFGFNCYGKFNQKPQDNTYTTIRWITLLFIPIFPIDAWRVSRSRHNDGIISKTYNIQYKARLRTYDILILCTVIISIIIILSLIILR